MKILTATLLALTLGAFLPPAQAASSDDVASCTASRLSQFVGPLGIQQSWPVTTELPGLSFNEPSVLLSDSGQVLDGYTQHLHVNVGTRSAYVVQQGGFAGKRTVFGPLPVSSCTPAEPPNNSIKPNLLRKSAYLGR